MDDLVSPVTLEESKLFQKIDRDLYTILVIDLWRDPLECLQIMGLWLLLERLGFRNVISKILSQPPLLINELADEAMVCLKCIDGAEHPFQVEATKIPLTQSLVKRDVPLQFFRHNRLTAYRNIQTLIKDVYLPVLSDIIERVQHGFDESSTQIQACMCHPASSSPAYQTRAHSSSDDYLMQSLSSLGICGDDSPSHTRAQENETVLYENTMFATFSKGYPVFESEIREFFTRLFGNCIESVYMQEVSPDEQALYARIVFNRPSFIQRILIGASKAKFTINGKHVWMCKFVPNNGRLFP